MSYQKTDWENLPSTNTPLIASNLNNIESGIENNELNNTLLGIKVDNIIGVDEYSSSSTYKVGDYCINGNTLYRCTTAINTAEAWNSSHWTATSIETELKKGSGSVWSNTLSATTNTSTTLATFGDTLTITTHGKPLIIIASCVGKVSSGNINIRVLMDSETSGVFIGTSNYSTRERITGFAVKTGVSAGQHSFKMAFAPSQNGNTATIQQYTSASLLVFEL